MDKLEGAEVKKPLGLSSHEGSVLSELSRAGGWTQSVCHILRKRPTGGGEVTEEGRPQAQVDFLRACMVLSGSQSAAHCSNPCLDQLFLYSPLLAAVNLDQG